MSSEQGSKNLGSYLLVAPTLVVVVVFLVLPLLLVLRVSFLHHVPLGYTNQPTLENYGFVFTNEGVRNTLAFTLETASIVTAVSLLLAYPVAYFLARKVKSFTLKTGFLVFLLIPFWIDFTTRSLAWIPWLGTQGIINDALLAIGAINQPATIFLYSSFAMDLVMVQAYTLFMVAPLFISMSKIDPILYEAAQTLGASRLRTFLHINLRLTLPGMGIGCVFVFLSSLADFATPKLIGGLVTSIGELIKDNVTFINLPNASAISALVVVIALAVLVLTFRLTHVEQIFE
ncbi:MAG: ABC transporter permease [Thaumarchaeota archaeon]|nr:MAG: ABC transporter permease [Nitrososphaerota archaeon]